MSSSCQCTSSKQNLFFYSSGHERGSGFFCLCKTVSKSKKVKTALPIKCVGLCVVAFGTCIHALNTAQHAPSSAKKQLEANFFLGIGFLIILKVCEWLLKYLLNPIAVGQWSCSMPVRYCMNKAAVVEQRINISKSWKPRHSVLSRIKLYSRLVMYK